MLNSHTTHAARQATSCLKAIVFLATLVSTLAPTTTAAADSPSLLQAGPDIARQVASELRDSPRAITVLRPAAPQAKRGFVSEDLIERVSGLINDGVQIAGGARNGTLYVNFESHGFGGIISLRLRR